MGKVTFKPETRQTKEKPYHNRQPSKARRISNAELADLPEAWENPTVDTSMYIQCATVAWEVCRETYDLMKADGELVQQYKGRFYAGAFIWPF